MDSENPPSLRHRLLLVVACLIALPLFYVLSIGPVLYVADKLHSGDRLLEELYFPLRWAVTGTPLMKPLDAYCDWWHWLAWPN